MTQPRLHSPGTLSRPWRTLIALAALFAIGCGTPPPRTASRPAIAEAVHTDATGCERASLALPEDTAVGTIAGETVLFSDLGAQPAEGERRALHEYCESVASIRDKAWGRFLDGELLASAAKDARLSEQDLLEKVAAERTPEPTDSEIQKYYQSIADKDTAPLDSLRDELIRDLKGHYGRRALVAYVSELRAKATYTNALPNLSPPPSEIPTYTHTPLWGPDSAPVTVTEFGDFECPYCGRAAETLHALKEIYGDRIRIAYRHMPLGFHRNAQLAATLSQCAQAQGKFWDVHDRFFAHQGSLDGEAMRSILAEAGVDMAGIDRCLASGEAAQQVARDISLAEQVGVRGTPSFYVNGRKPNSPALGGLTSLIELEFQRNK